MKLNEARTPIQLPQTLLLLSIFSTAILFFVTSVSAAERCANLFKRSTFDIIVDRAIQESLENSRRLTLSENMKILEAKTVVKFNGVDVVIESLLGAGSQRAVYKVTTPDGVRQLKIFYKDYSYKSILERMRFLDKKVPTLRVISADDANLMILMEYKRGLTVGKLEEHWRDVRYTEVQYQALIRRFFENQSRARLINNNGKYLTSYSGSNVLYAEDDDQFYLFDPG